MGGSAQIPNLVYAGAQDNGSSRLSNGIWTNVFGGDGMECAVDYSNPSIGYVSYQGGYIFRTTDGGNGNFESINSGVLESAGWLNPFSIHPTNPAILYRATTKVYKSTNRGNSWNAISGVLEVPPGSSYGLNVLKVSKSNPNFIYASAGRGGYLFRTSNGGSGWVILQTPTDFTSDITIHPDNPEIIYFTNSRQSGSNKIFKSTDAGNNWANVTGQLPINLSVNCIVLQDDFPADVYIGTDIGVFYSNTGGGNWQDYSVNLPNVIISELEINNISGKIRAATYGRGLWESPLNNTPVFVEEEHQIPVAFQLIQNYPNPFNPTTTIKYSITSESLVKIKIYDIFGREVVVLVNEQKSTGNYSIQFNGNNLASGVYLYRIQTGSFVDTKKMILMK